MADFRGLRGELINKTYHELTKSVLPKALTAQEYQVGTILKTAHVVFRSI